MSKRFVSIWFRHLLTDWLTIRQPSLNGIPFVLSTPSHGRMIVTSVNPVAENQGIHCGMVVADARAIVPSLKVFDAKQGLTEKLLKKLGEWCIRFTPFVSLDTPDGLMLEVTGCSHLWGGDEPYLTDIINRFETRGYSVKVAIADTIGAAWAVARFYDQVKNIKSAQQAEALLNLPPAALRIEAGLAERLHKLGLHHIRNFISMPRSALRRRFGTSFIQRLDQAFGKEEEIIQPLYPIEPYHERLPCLEPIVTATGIHIALERLLNELCSRLQQEQKGVRNAVFKCYRADGKMVKIEIGTNKPSYNADHLFRLFDLQLATIEPGPGIELFTLEASKVDDHLPIQEKLWEGQAVLYDNRLSELIDRLSGKFGEQVIHRYLPDEHHWPERSFKQAGSLQERSAASWRTDKPRPICIFTKPERVLVTTPIPDYPPMLFRYKEKLHKVVKADGPERIEQEWWIQEGEHRDYYCVEDEEGKKFWLFRSGHYTGDHSHQWFIHGFFA